MKLAEEQKRSALLELKGEIEHVKQANELEKQKQKVSDLTEQLEQQEDIVSVLGLDDMPAHVSDVSNILIDAENVGDIHTAPLLDLSVEQDVIAEDVVNTIFSNKNPENPENADNTPERLARRRAAFDLQCFRNCTLST